VKELVATKIAAGDAELRLQIERCSICHRHSGTRLYWLDDPRSEEDCYARETIVADAGGGYRVRPDD
jgi:hypothetical protein